MTKTSRHIELCYSVIYVRRNPPQLVWQRRVRLSPGIFCRCKSPARAPPAPSRCRECPPPDLGSASGRPAVTSTPLQIYHEDKVKKKMAGVKRRKSYFSIFTFAEELFEQSTFSNLPKYHFWKKKISRVARPLKTFNSQSDFDFCVRCNVRAPSPPPLSKN